MADLSRERGRPITGSGGRARAHRVRAARREPSVSVDTRKEKHGFNSLSSSLSRVST